MVGGRVAQYQEQKLRAAEIFVDRDEPKSIFVRTAQEFVASSPRTFKFLGFYGAGGQGKTSLCGALMKLFQEEPLRSRRIATAFIDLHTIRPGDYIHALVTIRNAIAAATGAPFACFDLAVADYYDQLGVLRPHMTIGAARLHGFAADMKEGIGETLVEGVKAGVGEVFTEAVGGVPFVGPSLKRMTKWAFAKGAETYLRTRNPVLQGLYGRSEPPNPKIIRVHLADILAHEFALWARSHRDRPVAIFIDEYENALPAGGSKFSVYTSSEWDEALRDFIAACARGRYEAADEAVGYAYEAGFLLLIFGRERLRWDRIDAGWAEEMKDQHLLGGLAPSDALAFLEEAGVEEPSIREAIVVASTAPDPGGDAVAAYPMMLDLGLQIYFDIKSAKHTPSVADFEIAGASYAEKRRSLLQRYLRNFNEHEGLEALLRRLACVREFDRDLVGQLSDHFARGFDRSYFDDLTTLNFVSPAGDGVNWVMHNHISETLRESLPPGAARETHEWLAAWFTKRGTPASSKEMTLDHAEALGDGIVHHAYAQLSAASLREGTRRGLLNWPAAQSRLRPACERALEIRRRHAPCDELEIAHALNMLGGVGTTENNGSEAEAFFHAALAIRERLLPADHPDIAASLRGLGIAHYLQDKFEEAKELFQRVYEIRVAQPAPDTFSIFISLHDLALVNARTKQRTEASRLFAEAVKTSKRLSPEHTSDVADLLYSAAWHRLSDDVPHEALGLAIQAVQLREESLPANHQEIREARLLLSSIHQALGNFREGVELAAAALRQEQREAPPQLDAQERSAKQVINACTSLRRQGEKVAELLQMRMPPLYSGGWRRPGWEFDQAVAAGLNETYFVDMGSGTVAFGEAYNPHGLRCLALPFWGSDWLLCEWEVDPALLHGLWNGQRFIMGIGKSEPIHWRNQSGIDLSTAELRLAYLTFFCSWVRAESGRFALVRTREDLAAFVPHAAQRETLISLISEPTECGFSDAGECSMSANIIYGDALFKSNFLLKRDGMLEMISDEPIATPGVTILPEIWATPFRLPALV